MQHHNFKEASVDESKEIPRADRVWIGATMYGLYMLGLAATESDIIDENCTMNNTRVPFYESDLTDAHRACLAEREKNTKAVMVSMMAFEKELAVTNVDVNSVEVVKGYATSLNRFHEYLKVRRDKAYVNGERTGHLTPLIVRGSWYLDGYGQVGTIIPKTVRYSEKGDRAPFDIAPLRKENSVLTGKQFTELLLDGNYGWDLDGTQCIPYNDTPCPHCNKGFTMQDAWQATTTRESKVISLAPYVGLLLKDVAEHYPREEGCVWILDYSIAVRNDRWIDLTEIERYGKTEPRNPYGWSQRQGAIVTPPYSVEIDHNTYVIQEGDEGAFTVRSFYHEDCLVAQLTQQFSVLVRDAFEYAGIEVTGMLPIKNDYGSELYRGKWLLVSTLNGNYFRIGWRKSVIACDLVSFEDGVVKNLDKQRHLNNTNHLARYLKSHFNTVTDETVSVSITPEPKTLGGDTVLSMVISFGCVASIAGIEAGLKKHTRYDWYCNAGDEVTVGERTTDNIPYGWEEAYPLLVDGRQIGHVSKFVVN